MRAVTAWAINSFEKTITATIPYGVTIVGKANGLMASADTYQRRTGGFFS